MDSITVLVCKKCGPQHAYYFKWSKLEKCYVPDEISLGKFRELEDFLPEWRITRRELAESECPKCGKDNEGDLPF